MKILAFTFALIVLASCGSNNAENTEIDNPQVVAEKKEPSTQAIVSGDKPKPSVARSKPDSHTAKSDRNAEDNLTAMILDLPEIREEDDKAKQAAKGRGLKVFVKERPSDDNEYYAIGVAEDNGSSLVTRYTFHIYPDNTIMVYDPVKDEEITLKKWRRSL